MKRVGSFKMDEDDKLRPLDYKINKLIEYYKKKSIPDYYLSISDEMASKADGEAYMASEIVEDLYELLGDE